MPDFQVELSLEDENWGDAEPLIAACHRAFGAAFDHAKIAPGRTEISVLLTDDARMKRLNHEWRGKDRPTNVLSFGEWNGKGAMPLLLGDIVLARETVQREAAEQGKSMEDHLSHLLVHGLLHLLGFDHENDDEAEAMERLERQACTALGIADPYANE